MSRMQLMVRVGVMVGAFLGMFTVSGLHAADDPPACQGWQGHIIEGMGCMDGIECTYSQLDPCTHEDLEGSPSCEGSGYTKCVNSNPNCGTGSMWTLYCDFGE